MSFGSKFFFFSVSLSFSFFIFFCSFVLSFLSFNATPSLSATKNPKSLYQNSQIKPYNSNTIVTQNHHNQSKSISLHLHSLCTQTHSTSVQGFFFFNKHHVARSHRKRLTQSAQQKDQGMYKHMDPIKPHHTGLPNKSQIITTWHGLKVHCSTIGPKIYPPHYTAWTNKPNKVPQQTGPKRPKEAHFTQTKKRAPDHPHLLGKAWSTPK